MPDAGTFDIVATAVGTGAVSTAGTIVALRVHIMYLREMVAELRKDVDGAHARLNNIPHPWTPPK